MAALTGERNTQQMGEAPKPALFFPQKGSTTIYKGSLVALNGGYAAPGATATGRIAVGRAKKTQTNSGADGAVSIEVEEGIFKFANLGADAIVAADVGAQAWIADDQTVAKTNGTNTRSVAGRIVKLDSDGVWVRIGLGVG